MRRLADAKDAKTRAAAWLERRDRADWSEADQADLDKWLAQSPGNLLAYWRVEAAWDNTEPPHRGAPLRSAHARARTGAAG